MPDNGKINPAEAAAREREGLVLGLIAVAVFGLTLPAMRIAVADLDPVFVGLGRALVAAALAAPTLWLTGQPLPRRSDWIPLAITAACVVFAFPFLATLAMLHAPAAHGGVVLAILPLATALASVLFAGERPSAGFWLCAVTGTGLVAAYAWLDGAGDAALHWADLLLLGAVISVAVGYATGGALSRRLGGWQVICWALVIASPAMALVVWFGSGPINWAAPASAWLSFGYIAIFSQFLGFFAWNNGLARGGVAKVGQLQLVQPFVTLAGAMVIAGERITFLEVGFAIAVVAVVAIGRRMPVAAHDQRSARRV